MKRALAAVLGGAVFAATGAIWLLYALDYNLSVAVWVGIIALAGRSSAAVAAAR